MQRDTQTNSDAEMEKSASKSAPMVAAKQPAPAPALVKTLTHGASPANKAALGTSQRSSDSVASGKRTSGDSNSCSRRRVVWDEQNLEANEEYRRTHPVTLHIDEPKTPYVHIDDDMQAMMDSEDSQWDPKVNAYVKKVKEEAQKALHNAGPVAPIAKNGRPMLATGTTNGQLEKERHDREFRSMRKAVYADEGAKFKEMLAKQKGEEDGA